MIFLVDYGHLKCQILLNATLCKISFDNEILVFIWLLQSLFSAGNPPISGREEDSQIWKGLRRASGKNYNRPISMSIPYDMDVIWIASPPICCDIKRLSGWWGKSKKEEEEGLRIHLQSISSSMTWRHCQGMWPIIELLPPATETQMQPKIMSFQNSSATNFEESDACSVLRDFTFQALDSYY